MPRAIYAASQFASQIDGADVRTGRFARSLRQYLFAEHLGSAAPADVPAGVARATGATVRAERVDWTLARQLYAAWQQQHGRDGAGVERLCRAIAVCE